MTIISLLVLNIIWMIFFLYSRFRDEKKYREIFREYALAAKSRNVQEYVEALPADNEKLEVQPQDEVVELENVDPETILKAEIS